MPRLACKAISSATRVTGHFVAGLSHDEALCLEGIGAVAQVLPKLVDIVLCNFFGEDRMPDADLYVGAVLVQHLMNETYGAEAGVYLAQEMEELGIGAFEIYGNHRESGALDHLHHIVCPGLVFYDLLLAYSGAPGLFLIGSNFSGREESHGAAFLHVLKGHAYAFYALGTATFGEIVHRHESVPEAGNKRQGVCGKNAVVGPFTANDGAEDEAVYAAEMMVGNGDESSLFGDIGKLFGDDFVGGAHFFEDHLCILRAGIIRYFCLYGVDFVQFQKAMNAARYEAAETPFEIEGFLQVGFRYYVRLFFHKKWQTSKPQI